MVYLPSFLNNPFPLEALWKYVNPVIPDERSEIRNPVSKLTSQQTSFVKGYGSGFEEFMDNNEIEPIISNGLFVAIPPLFITWV